MDKQTFDEIQSIFVRHKDIGLAYFFGSRALGEEGPMSDYDFAVHFDKDATEEQMFSARLSLMDCLGRCLKTDKVDVVVLNTTESPELKYEIVKNGKLVFEREPYKVIVEPMILNEYFDFHFMLVRNGLTAG